VDGSLEQLEADMYATMVLAGIRPPMARVHVNARIQAEVQVRAGVPRHLAEARSAAILETEFARAARAALASSQAVGDTTTSSAPPSPDEEDDTFTVQQDENSTTDAGNSTTDYDVSTTDAEPPGAQEVETTLEEE
jgi:hypothetical protein